MEIKRLIAIIALATTFGCLSAELVTIGHEQVVNQGLPIEPVARYSYSQQLFTTQEIGSSGLITCLGFQYNAVSNYFYNGINQWKIWLGHSNRSALNSWIPLDSLTIVYDNTLQMSDFSAGIPGSGWLTIELEQPFFYNGTDKLVVAVDENSNDFASTADDFYCTFSEQQYAIQFQNANLNPDPANPPTSGYTLKTHRSNLQITIQAMHFTPVQPVPQNGATGVAINGNLSWVSLCSSFDLRLGTHPDSLLILGTGINTTLWQLESPLEYNHLYYWQVTGHLDGQTYPSQIWNFRTMSETCSAPQNLSGFYNGNGIQLSWQAPASGTASYFKLYRNSAFFTNCLVTNLLDTEVQAGITYYYQVSAVTASGSESALSNLISVSVPNSGPVPILFQGFEGCQSFSQLIAGWQNNDLDASPTWDWPQHSFPGEGSAFGWFVFEPTATTPPATSFQVFAGQKMAVSLSAINPPNNDWLISPAIHLGSSASVSFKARSADTNYGSERLRVLLSTTGSDPGSFQSLQAGAFLEVPAEWTEYSYDLSAYSGQRVYLAWNCLSVDAMALGLDEINVYSEGGYVSNQDDYVPVLLFRSYPNPARSGFKVSNPGNRPFRMEIFNLRGQLLFAQDGLADFDSRQSDLKLSSGIYLIRISQPGRTQLLKQIILK